MLTFIMLTAWGVGWWAALSKIGNRFARLALAFLLAVACQVALGFAMLLLDPSLLE